VASQEPQPNQGQQSSQGTDFRGQYLLALSDTDMVGTAYIDGNLGERQPGVEDTLSIIPLPDRFRSEGLGARENPVSQVKVSNSVNGIGNSMVLSRDARTAFVIEVKQPAPANATRFDEQPLGTKLNVIDLSNPTQPRIVQQVSVGRAPEAIDINPDGTLLAVVTGDAGKVGEPIEVDKRIQLIPVDRNGRLGTPQNFSLPGIENQQVRISNVRWHPSGQFIAVNLPLAGQVMFYQVQRNPNGTMNLTPWGSPVTAGKFSANGEFTPDGQFFVTNALQWGEDVEGFFIDPPAGEIRSIRFDSQASNKNAIAHEVVSTATVGQNPESLKISPDGAFVVTANMRNTGLLWNDPRLATESSLSLVTIDQKTGRLTTQGEYLFEGILPQGLAFDKTGTGLAVTLLDRFDLSSRRGAIEFWRVIPGSRPALQRTGFSVSTVRGPYQLVLIP
jgi:DNA-binding beta-propeller fold protein YncE